MSKRGVTVVNQMDLWDMPAMLPAARGARERGVGVSEVAGAGVSARGPADRWTGGRAQTARGLASSSPLSSFRAALYAQTHLVIVSGLGGEEKYVASFAKLSQTLADAANKRFGIPAAEIHVVRRRQRLEEAVFPRAVDEGERRARDRRSSRRARAPAIRSCSCSSATAAATAKTPRSAFPVPTSARATSRSCWRKFPTQKVAFVNLTSASGDMLPVVSAPNRVIITATKSAFERNESHFAQFFVDALTKDVADIDKDGRVSLLEAFRYAVVETKRLYENDTRLQTEHAQLDDMGAKTGVADPDGRTAQGLLARRFFLDGGISATAANDPQLVALYKDKFALEDQIDQLRGEEASMTADAYDDALEDAARAARAQGEDRSARSKGGSPDDAASRSRGSVSLAFALALVRAALDGRAGRRPRSVSRRQVSGGHRRAEQGSGERQRVGRAQRDLVRAYATIGKYDEAEAAARRAVLSPKGGIALEPARRSAARCAASARPAESAFVRAAPSTRRTA